MESSSSLPRLLLWPPQLAALECLLAGHHDLPRPMWQAAQLVIVFALAREDRGVLIDRLASRFVPSTTCGAD